ncbi:hypothetical protein [Rathayibacter tanaceti]|uniref:Uncharacterized protein n=2 Tax=Rathayibacter tanaceti TaxID=1671680 RepID=A0A162IZ18_9MICO|nr:hypothetical protein [Rathayibacter tanaceti]KZX19847.1 hypothetical protein ACH61_03057 [Rathayibacter tanaceti]QHC54518.1 hypothetical protein GSU10_01825 [Rathayibacter tanaceti]TCO33930.1 hypothetical protein EV639_11279 [Rathayibacter tanaceti]
MTGSRGDNDHVRSAFPGKQALAQVMQHGNADPPLSINAIYWAVSTTALEGLLDQVRTRLVASR